MAVGRRSDAGGGARRRHAWVLPLGVALVVGGVAGLVGSVAAGWPVTPFGSVLALLLGARLVLRGLRHRRRPSATDASTTGDGAVSSPPTTADVVTREQVLEQVRTEVLPGFTPRSAVVERVSDYFEDCTGPTSPVDVERVVEAVWTERLAEERAWTAPGDHAMVQAAFDDLERRGFVARMDFTCCQTCGHDEIGDERRGDQHSYVFFHAQDSERLAEDDTDLYLAFGCFDSHPALDRELLEAARRPGGEKLRARVAAERAAAETRAGLDIADTLRRHGLGVTWDQTPTSRPCVQIESWRKPLPR